MEKDFSYVDKLFEQSFSYKPNKHFVSYGRIEIIGNHTDHQGGRCLVGTCSQEIKGSLSKRDDDVINFISEGYEPIHLNIKDLEQNKNEYGTSLSLIKGVLKGYKDHGYNIGGFDTTIISNIYKGAGVSSSAAFELYVAEVLNVLFNEGKVSKIEKAKIGQFAENVYFGKASGLLDQSGSSFGGICFLDFSDSKNPIVEPLKMPSWPVKIFIVNPGSSHEGLSDLYSEMPNDMKYVAKTVFDKNVLSEVSLKEFYAKIYDAKINDRARNRALYFMSENSRVLRAKKAIETNNFDWFLETLKETQLAQMSLLKNVMIEGHYSHSPLEAVDRASMFLDRGSPRVMGGGLAGSIICFVPNEEVEGFLKGMKQYYSNDNIVEVFVPSDGAHEVK